MCSWWGRKKRRSTPHGRVAHSLLAPHSGLAQTLPHWLPRYYRPVPSPQVMPPCWHVPLSELELLGASPKEKLLQAGLVQLHLCESDVASWAKSPSGGIILENGTSFPSSTCYFFPSHFLFLILKKQLDRSQGADLQISFSFEPMQLTLLGSPVLSPQTGRAVLVFEDPGPCSIYSTVFTARRRLR